MSRCRLPRFLRGMLGPLSFLLWQPESIGASGGTGSFSFPPRHARAFNDADTGEHRPLLARRAAVGACEKKNEARKRSTKMREDQEEHMQPCNEARKELLARWRAVRKRIYPNGIGAGVASQSGGDQAFLGRAAAAGPCRRGKRCRARRPQGQVRGARPAAAGARADGRARVQMGVLSTPICTRSLPSARWQRASHVEVC